MKIAVVGLGGTGSHCARQLVVSSPERLYLFDSDTTRLKKVANVIGQQVDVATFDPDYPPADIDVAIVASPTGTHLTATKTLLAAGCHVVSLSDDLTEVEGLLTLHDEAMRSGLHLVVGAGFAPGLTCLLSRLAARPFDKVFGINIAKFGTGGPACARQHHRALKKNSYEWFDGRWNKRRGGTGRTLLWFPDPIGAKDCYRAALPSPMLLHQAFPQAERISAHMEANRRDRVTSGLPMLRPPHKDGGPGAVRVEVRGVCEGKVHTSIYAVMDFPTVAAGTVAAVAAAAVVAGEAPVGAVGLALWDDPFSLLKELHRRGVKVAEFTTKE